MVFTGFDVKSYAGAEYDVEMSININGLLTIAAKQTGWTDGSLVQGEF